MRHYFAVFMPIVEGGYAVEFPDIPEAFTEGTDLDECMALAADVLSIAVEEYTKARKDLPAPSGIHAVKEYAAREMITGPGTDASRELLYQLFAAPDMDMTPVRINVSFPKCVLTSIDQKAHMLGMTRSGFLAHAASVFASHP